MGQEIFHDRLNNVGYAKFHADQLTDGEEGIEWNYHHLNVAAWNGLWAGGGYVNSNDRVGCYDVKISSGLVVFETFRARDLGPRVVGGSAHTPASPRHTSDWRPAAPRRCERARTEPTARRKKAMRRQPRLAVELWRGSFVLRNVIDCRVNKLYNARNSAAVKLVVKASRWREIGRRERRIKGQDVFNVHIRRRFRAA
ncbi:hypothetical protein EVAR_78665_1 [Eumeta japonica]|uniref:Uncharacterized protein n=1 Tax=Eumeta variegata TaxID=151549 RepID=A0A4C1U858_EUMVA|nr:hypothetical protein EVAR_78665_1 [Eumeta japonica]